MNCTRYTLPVRLPNNSEELVMTYKEVCDFLRVDPNVPPEEENVIVRLMREARGICEGYIKKSLIPTTYTQYLSGWWTGKLRLQAIPFIGVESIKYFDESGTEQTLGTVNYRVVHLSNEWAAVKLVTNDLPALQKEPDGSIREDAISITFTAGYSPSNPIPKSLINAMKLMIGAGYDKRVDGVDDRTKTAEKLMDQERWVVIG